MWGRRPFHVSAACVSLLITATASEPRGTSNFFLARDKPGEVHREHGGDAIGGAFLSVAGNATNSGRLYEDHVENINIANWKTEKLADGKNDSTPEKVLAEAEHHLEQLIAIIESSRLSAGVDSKTHSEEIEDSPLSSAKIMDVASTKSTKVGDTKVGIKVSGKSTSHNGLQPIPGNGPVDPKQQIDKSRKQEEVLDPIQVRDKDQETSRRLNENSNEETTAWEGLQATANDNKTPLKQNGKPKEEKSGGSMDNAGLADKEGQPNGGGAVGEHPDNKATTEDNGNSKESKIPVEQDKDTPVVEANGSLGRRVLDAILNQDINSLQAQLLEVTRALVTSENSIDVNAGYDSDGISNATWLQAAVCGKATWVAGVQELLSWDASRQDKGKRLDLDLKYQKSSTALMCAVDANDAKTVNVLVEAGASPTIPNAEGVTPLEVAAPRDARLVDALTGNQSVLADGLADLQARLKEHALNLTTWEIIGMNKEPLQTLQTMLPKGIEPKASEKEHVGESPANWILLYKAKVMHALSVAELVNRESELLLSKHNFDALLRNHSLFTIALSISLGMFAITCYLVFRLKVYGHAWVPVSMSHLLPGALDPQRTMAPDFDASQCNKTLDLPYKAALYLGNSRPSPAFKDVAVAFGKGFSGVYIAWSLQCIRIPPEDDANDEEYASDEDEVKRASLRSKRVYLAMKVRDVEVVLRSLGLFILIWWFGFRMKRWIESCLLLCATALYAAVAACVMMDVSPRTGTPNFAVGRSSRVESQGPRDMWAAGLAVYQLFSSQHGDRWPRAVPTIRGTASKKKESKSDKKSSAWPKGVARAGSRGSVTWESQGRSKRRSRAGRGAEISDSQTSDDGGVSAADAGGGEAKMVGASSGEEVWKSAFVAEDLLHTPHWALLENTMPVILFIALMLLWSRHWYGLIVSSFREGYSSMEAHELVRVYGPPGSLSHMISLIFELTWLVVTGERLVGAARVPGVGTLALCQRCRALDFLEVQEFAPARALGAPVEDCEDFFKSISAWEKCRTFACELSQLRWAALQRGVLLCTLVVADLLAKAIVGFFILPGCWFRALAVQLALGLCIAWPVFWCLLQAAIANHHLRQQCVKLNFALEHVAINATPEEQVRIPELRVRARSIVESCSGKSNEICWPWCQRPIGFTEPFLVLLLSFTSLVVAMWHFLGLYG